eukprot:m.21898 g.21898  ORF g.21898 m.21898 type:complete len:202 (+) comp12564_c0_seq2:277-882(+)
MFSLLSGLVQYLFQRPEYFILMIGLDGAGKTCLLEKFKGIHNKKYSGTPLDKVSPTIGLNVGRVDVAGVRLVFWDLGGDSELQCLWEKYYKEVHAVVFVIDSTDKKRLQQSKEAFDLMVESHELDGVPLLLLANKQDRTDAMSVAQIKEVFNASAPKLGVRDCKVQDVSAFSGENLPQMLKWLSRSVQRNHDRPPAQADFS